MTGLEWPNMGQYLAPNTNFLDPHLCIQPWNIYLLTGNNVSLALVQFLLSIHFNHLSRFSFKPGKINKFRSRFYSLEVNLSTPQFTTKIVSNLNQTSYRIQPYSLIWDTGSTILAHRAFTALTGESCNMWNRRTLLYFNCLPISKFVGMNVVDNGWVFH